LSNALYCYYLKIGCHLLKDVYDPTMVFMRLIGKSIFTVFVSAVFVFISFFILKSEIVLAAGNTCTWTDLGGDNKFSNPTNWSGCAGGVPTSGDDIVIVEPSNQSENSNLLNDLTGLTVNSITVSGIEQSDFLTNIEGNEITVASGIHISQYSTTGQKLAEIFEQIPDRPRHDQELIDAWGKYLGITDWYTWVPYQPPTEA
jgi:hypothetical protein